MKPFVCILLISGLLLASCDKAPEASFSEVDLQVSNYVVVPLNGQFFRYRATSAFVDERYVDIWLPESYDGTTPHAVLYMHDGQMLFDDRSTWNKQEWQVDEVIDRLLTAEVIRPVIVVGVWNNGEYRGAEYFPEKAISLIDEAARPKFEERFSGDPLADRYLRFLVKELKPFVDANFNVHTDAANTFIAGASMGGLISMYAVTEYPGVFGGAACLSTHWIGTFEDNDAIPAAFRKYLESRLPVLDHHALYFDYGTVGLDSLYIRHQTDIDAMLREKAGSGLRWKSLAFEGAEHMEIYWARRLHIPFEFLMPK